MTNYSDPDVQNQLERQFAAERNMIVSGISKDVAAYITPSSLMRPSVVADGDMYCALTGPDLQIGVCGFGRKHFRAPASPLRQCQTLTIFGTTKKTWRCMALRRFPATQGFAVTFSTVTRKGLLGSWQLGLQGLKLCGPTQARAETIATLLIDISGCLRAPELPPQRTATLPFATTHHKDQKHV